MHIKLVVLVTAFLSLFVTTINAQESSMTDHDNLRWYEGSPCTSASITKFRSADSRPPRPDERATITEPQLLATITGILDQLPMSGSEYKKMSADTPRLHLSLTCDNQISDIDFFDGRIKTPATSFYADRHPLETKLYDLLQQQLGFKLLDRIGQWFSNLF